MAQFQTADGRWLVGDVEGNGEYSGFLGWRDCVIQLTANGATEQSVKYLEALRDYAFNRNSLGEPIAPPSVNVWVSNNGKTVAVQADDYAVDGNTFTICGIKWTGSAWDYTNAGQGGGGGGGGGSLVVTLTSTTVDEQEILSTDKTAGEIFAALPNATFQQANNRGIYKIFSTVSYAEMDGLFYIYLLDLSDELTRHSVELYATSTDAVMTSEEPSDDTGGN